MQLYVIQIVSDPEKGDDWLRFPMPRTNRIKIRCCFGYTITYKSNTNDVNEMGL